MREGEGRVQGTAAFRELIREKRTFVISAFTFLLIFFFPLPILTAFTTLLDRQVIGALNWAYLYSFALFGVAWVVAILYWIRARRFDELAQRVREEAEKDEDTST
jgi:uncharacterized membrane protein (DUF485 family)